MTLQIGSITVIQAASDATGWRLDEMPSMDGCETKSFCNLRAGPSAKAGVVAVLKPGMRVVVLGADEDGWAGCRRSCWTER